MNTQVTPMTNPQSVDVLAVMDAQIRVANGLAYGRPSEALDDLKKARAAVAELILIADNILDQAIVNQMVEDEYSVPVDVLDELRDTLIRIGAKIGWAHGGFL